MILDKYFRRHGSQDFLAAVILKAIKRPTVQHLTRYGENGEFFKFSDEDLVITDPRVAIKIERILARLHPGGNGDLIPFQNQGFFPSQF